METAHHAARQCLRSTQNRQRAYYNMKLKQHQFEEGDLVYKLDTTTKVGLTTK